MRNTKTVLVAMLGLLLVLNILKLHSSIYDDTRHLGTDEDSHLYNAYYYKLFFLDRDFDSPEWGSFAFYDQPPVAKYFVGFALHLVNGTVIETDAGAKDWHRRALGDFWIPRLEDIRDDRVSDPAFAARADRLVERGNALLEETGTREPLSSFTERDVIVGRLAVFAFELLALGVLLAAIWYVTGNSVASLLAGLMFVSSPLTVPVFQQVYTDSLWCFFVLGSLLALFALLRSLRKNEVRKALVYSVIIGLGLALAIGTKIIAVYMALAVAAILALAAVLYVVRGRTGKTEDAYASAKLSALSLAAVSVVSVILFVAINPFLYEHTVTNFLRMFEHREVIMEMQLLTQGPVIETVSQRVRAVAEFGILNGYETKSALGLNLAFGYLCIMLVGMHRMLVRAKREMRLGAVGPYASVAILSVISYAFIGMTVHMEWERYFLPILLCNVFWFAFGIDAVAERVK